MRRTAALSVKEGVVADYVHNQVADGLGKIGVLVALESTGDEADACSTLGRQLAMHVAAASPLALDISAVPAEVLEREKAILAEKNQGKTPEVLEKMIAGGLKSLRQGKLLLEQQYIHDTTKTVAQAVKEAESRPARQSRLSGFVRYALGEGIEKKEEDFAAEVAQACGRRSASAQSARARSESRSCRELGIGRPVSSTGRFSVSVSVGAAER